MEKHIKLVGVLNIVYRCVVMVGSLVLFFIAAIFSRIMDYLERRGELHAEDVPREILDFVPFILLIIGIVIAIVSIVGIVGALGVMKRKEWGRILLIVVSFFNTLRVPVGTALGAYSLWVLFNDETIRIFNPLPPDRQEKVQT
jgi:ABC-type polysaccharide/polyol phosphate export permease